MVPARWRLTGKRIRVRGGQGTEFRKGISRLLLNVGAFLLVFVAGNYLWMHEHQHHLMQQWQAQATGTTHSDSHTALTRLRIPKIALDVVIMEGTSSRSLTLGPGHLKNTADPGATGNAVIAAHRDTYFRHLHELAEGDEILVQREGKTFRYLVTGERIVQPTDLSVLENSDESRLTLITCYPTYYIGPAPKRLVVFAKLSGNAESAAVFP